MKTVNFGGLECRVKMETYPNGRFAITLIAPNNELVTVATVNLPREELKDNHVFIKAYSENEGIIEPLEKAGIIQLTGRLVTLGYVTVPEAKLLI